MTQVLLLVGTRKGLFILDSDEGRRDWQVRGPFCESWPIFHAIFDPASSTIYAAAASDWHGTAVWRSTDLGATWTHSSEGLNYGEDGPKFTKASSLNVIDGTIYAGVHLPGIFKSDDQGENWSYFTGLEDQEARKTWMNPEVSPPGDLGIIALEAHPQNSQQLIANVQGFGLWMSEDGGKSWATRNNGFRSPFPQEDPSWGYCVHKITTSPADPERLYTQTHFGVFRTDDRGGTWHEITEGLPTDFGFPVVAHPHDRDTAFFIPVDPDHARSTPGKLVVWRTQDAGGTWQALTNGLPQEHAFLGVLREGMSGDGLDDPGLYFGTSTGEVFASADAGESWSEVAAHLPGIASVEAVVLS
jgi:photosystem II stability/assembly factor-like uncharacterized protein